MRALRGAAVLLAGCLFSRQARAGSTGAVEAPPPASGYRAGAQAPTAQERRARCEGSRGVWDDKLNKCRCEGLTGFVEFRERCALQYHKVTAMQVQLVDLVNLYSPSVLTQTIKTPQGPKTVKSLWTGGWLAAEDSPPPTGDGVDKIFYSELGRNGWSRPERSFAPPGFHVNDPSVIIHPDHPDWRFMYYTALSNDGASDFENMTQRNVVGLASSIDGGRTWTDRGIVIDHDNGLDKAGGWSPSALVVGKEIWVYYHTGSRDFDKPITLRTRFDLNGWQPLGKPDRLVFTDDRFGDGTVTQLSNVDVARQGSSYVLVGNTLGLDQVLRFVSKDGLSWTRDPVEPLINGAGKALALTPHLEVSGATGYSVYFGYAIPPAWSQSLHRWDFSGPAPAPR